MAYETFKIKCSYPLSNKDCHKVKNGKEIPNRYHSLQIPRPLCSLSSELTRGIHAWYEQMGLEGGCSTPGPLICMWIKPCLHHVSPDDTQPLPELAPPLAGVGTSLRGTLLEAGCPSHVIASVPDGLSPLQAPVPKPNCLSCCWAAHVALLSSIRVMFAFWLWAKNMLRILDFARSLLNLPSLFLSFLQNMQLSEVCQRDIYQRTLKKKKAALWFNLAAFSCPVKAQGEYEEISKKGVSGGGQRMLILA